MFVDASAIVAILFIKIAVGDRGRSPTLSARGVEKELGLGRVKSALSALQGGTS